MTRKRPLLSWRQGTILCLVTVLLIALTACQWPSPDPSLTEGSSAEPTDSTAPVLTPTPSASQSESTTETTPPETTGLPAPELTDPARYGDLTRGESLQLPGGQWYDLTAQGILQGARDLVVEATGTGWPTLSRPEEDSPILTISDSDNLTFRNIRFGYARFDYAADTLSGLIPLLSISNSSRITFESCEFFGGQAEAILLAGSEAIRLVDCQFYNLAGSPLATDETALPSQLDVVGCSFESFSSGLMPLHVRGTLFDQCTFMGRDGYQIPVEAAVCPAAVDTMSGLYRELSGILAGRIFYHRDGTEALTIRQSLFCSQDVYTLYHQIEQQIDDQLPDTFSQIALTGEKAEEAQPGALLDPTLGLRIDVRVETGGQPAYDQTRLLSDLQPLAELGYNLDDRLDGTLIVRIFDQRQQPVLHGEMPLDNLHLTLSPASPTDWLTDGDWQMMLPQLIPEDFAPAVQGRITALDAEQVLRTAWPQEEDRPLFIKPDPDADRQILLQTRLDYLGTKLATGAASHQFELSLSRSTGPDQPDCLARLLIGRIDYHALNGSKQLTVAHSGLSDSIQLADQETRDRLMAALAEPYALTLPDSWQDYLTAYNLSVGDRVNLTLLPLLLEEAWQVTPVLVSQQNETTLTAWLPLYDEQVRPWLVKVVLISANEQWQVDQVLVQ